MMQPDEIIQQKEWQELSAAEKLSIAELAGSEAEFNLLKKMLSVSAEEVAETPMASPALYEQIIAAIPPATRRSPAIKLWPVITAAASLLIIASLFFLLNKKEKKDIYVVKTNTIDTAISQVQPLLQKPDTAVSAKIVTIQKRPTGQQKNKTLLPKPEDASPPLQDSSLLYSYALQTTVASDPALLHFITEAE